MQADAIKVSHVHKTFKLPHEKQSSIKGILVNFYKRKKGYEKQHVLDSVSFEIKKGEFFGIVGRNGSGKSTLLKLLAGIYNPDSGDIQVDGKLTPFIELGVGFNPELTGRENVFLNGALLGFSRKEMGVMYDDIVEFAELHRFMDQKLKNYSSGMQVRLAFSIAIKVQSDILVLDEVLAVGDEAFQEKCIGVFERYKARNQTIVLVTHDMRIVERFCDRAMLIRNGKIVEIGSPRVVASMYSDSNKAAYDEHQETEEKKTNDNIDVRVLDPTTGTAKKRFNSGEEILIELKWRNPAVKHAGVAIYKRSGEYVFGPNTYKEKIKIPKGNKLYYRVKLNISPGEYYLKAGLFEDTDREILEFVDQGPVIIVEPAKGNSAWEGLTYLPHSWGKKDIRL
jgi:ABC-2 type transport system ATP-binding protein